MAGEVQIKGTRSGLVILLPTTSNFDELKHILCQKMESAKGFFQGARFTLHQEKESLLIHQKQELEQLLTGYGLVPMPDTTPSRQRPSRPAPVDREGRGAGGRDRSEGTGTHILRRNVPNECDAQADTQASRAGRVGRAEAVAPAAPPAGERTHLVWRTIRSGQQVRNDFGHLVIMGDVHSGALVEAGGHVLIMGGCAGTVRAGIHGNQQAKITSLDFKGAVVCIANAYLFTSEPGSGRPARGPYQAALQGGKIAFTPI